ncbi:MAG: M48 family metallopeptidase [Elusimicrobia bacterium]|nr:M48 family metallopeptidase [Elusimicrobiota bacterium]
MPALVYKNKTINYHLTPSKRRGSIVMRVNKDASVHVRAPRFTSINYIEGFLKERFDWIIKRQNSFKKLAGLYPAKEFRTGEMFPLFDQSLKLNIERAKKQRVPICELDGKNLNLFIGDVVDLKFKAAASCAIRDFYGAQIKMRAIDIAGKYSKFLNVKMRKLSIGNQKRIWGSCSRKGDIRLNWRLALMPFDVMEYIVVHELCHLKVHGHCAKFWKAVEGVLPDYRKHRGWLRRNGLSVFFISDWG